MVDTSPNAKAIKPQGLLWPVHKSGYEVVDTGDASRFPNAQLKGLRIWPIGERWVSVRNYPPHPCYPENRSDLIYGLSAAVPVSAWDDDRLSDDFYAEQATDDIVARYDDPNDGYDLRNPMQDVRLHRKFAKLAYTRESVIRFVNQHGLLGKERKHYPLIIESLAQDELDEGSLYNPITRSCETLDDYYVSIAVLKHLIMLHDAKDDQRSKYVRTPSGVDDYDIVALMPNPNYVLGKSPEPWVPMVLLNESAQNDVTESVRVLTTDCINRELAGHTDSILVSDSMGSHIEQVPRSLYGALWLHFALEVAELGQRLECRRCGNPFWQKRTHTGKDGNTMRAGRSDRIYCSKSCKESACRDRRNANRNANKRETTDCN